MRYTAKVSTFLKRTPVEANSLEEYEKKAVEVGKSYFIEEILGTDGLHTHVELQFEAGSWWVFVPHWDIDSEEEEEVKAVFLLKLAKAPNLIYGYLAFNQGEEEILRVRATSGQPGHQYPGAHKIKGLGCIPPDNDWKISTNGYYLSTPGVAGMFYHITPDPDPDTGRSEFGLHRDSNASQYPGSAGCIVVKTSDFDEKVRPILDGLREKQPSISLRVAYS